MNVPVTGYVPDPPLADCLKVLPVNVMACRKVLNRNSVENLKIEEVGGHLIVIIFSVKMQGRTVWPEHCWALLMITVMFNSID